MRSIMGIFHIALVDITVLVNIIWMTDGYKDIVIIRDTFTDFELANLTE